MTIEEYYIAYKSDNKLIRRCYLVFSLGFIAISMCLLGLSYFLNFSCISVGTQITFSVSMLYDESFWVMFLYGVISIVLLMPIIFTLILSVEIFKVLKEHYQHRKGLYNQLGELDKRIMKRSKTITDIIK